MRSVEIRNGRLFYYGSAVGYLEGDGITADPMFRREDLERWLERKNLPVRWVDGVYDRLASGGPIQNARPLKSLRIGNSSQIPPSKCASLGWSEWPENSMAPTQANIALLMMGRLRARSWKTSGTSSAAGPCPEESARLPSQM